MKTIMGILLLIISVAALIFGVDYLYDKTIANQGSSPAQQTALKIQEQLSENVFDKSSSSEPFDKLRINQGQSTPPPIINGFDWTLPAGTQEESNSGLILSRYRQMDVARNSFLIVRWDESNPQQNQYDFKILETRLRQLAPKKVLIRLEVNSSCEAPRWALDQLRESKHKSLIFWDQNYIELLRPFINEFAKRYSASPQVIGVQLGLGDGEYSGPCKNYDNKDGWGEFWMSPRELEEATTRFGFTPEVFASASKANIDIYVNAFGKHKNKLAFTNIGALFSYGKGSKPYNAKLNKIAKYVLEKGVGNRDGAIEQWMSYTDKIYGNVLTSMPDGTCRLDFDENYANKIRGRYWGTENEFYGKKDSVLAVHGSYENQPYRFLISSLRALQMRRNYMSISDMRDIDHPQYKTQDFIRYLTKVLGKQIENTPDAFVLLGERYIDASRLQDHKEGTCVKNSGNKIAIRSFGRWLTENSQSLPTIKTSMPERENFWDQGYYLPNGIDYEYFAREAKQFSFDLNDQLAKIHCANGCPVEVKITFKDTLKTTLNVLVAEGRTPFVKTQGDGQIKTATFKLTSRFNNGVSGSDFLVKSENGVLPVILVRVNFLKLSKK